METDVWWQNPTTLVVVALIALLTLLTIGTLLVTFWDLLVSRRQKPPEDAGDPEDEPRWWG